MDLSPLEEGETRLETAVRDCLPHRPAEGQLFLHALGGVLSLFLSLW